MKLIGKYISLVLIVLAYIFISPVNSIFSYELNIVKGVSYLADSLYNPDISVSTKNMLVLDYVIENDRLYIFPTDNNVCLPIDVMIVKVDDYSIEVVDYNNRYVIKNISNRSKNLYQYINSNISFAKTNDFFIVEGEYLDNIVNKLVIYYEKV